LDNTKTRIQIHKYTYIYIHAQTQGRKYKQTHAHEAHAHIWNTHRRRSTVGARSVMWTRRRCSPLSPPASAQEHYVGVSHTVVTLLSHCCHTVGTLLLHCWYTVATL
jgi:hypothetical protein